MVVLIDNLKPGYILSESIYKYDKVFILSGTKLTTDLITKIQKLQIKAVNILDDESISVTKELIPSSYREVIKKNLLLLNYNNLIDIAQDLASKVINAKVLQYDLSRYSYGEDDMYERAINIAIYSTFLGKIYNEKCTNRNKKINLEELALCSLLNNMGKITENDNILKMLNPIKLDRTKFPGFDPECFNRYNNDMHMIYAYSLLSNNPMIPKSVTTAILFSEENEKGTGSLGVSTNLTSRKETSMTMSKIIHLCSIYDDLLFKIIKKGPLEKKESPSNVIEILDYAKKNGIVNEELADLLFKAIPLYPVGTKVKLSDGNKATVVELSRDLTLPIVKIDDTTKIINLLTTNNLSINYIENS